MNATAYGPHFKSLRDVPDVGVVETHDMKAVRTHIRRSFKNRTVAVITGRVGSGKSFAVARAAGRVETETDAEVVWVEMVSAGSDKEQLAALWRQLTGSSPAPKATAGDIRDGLNDAFAERPRLLILDEAQHARSSLLRQLRWFGDRTDADFGLVLAGTPDLRSKMPREIESRCDGDVEMHSIADNEAATVLAALHPIFAAADPALLATLNHTRARGSFRWWAKFLGRAYTMLPRLGGELTPETVSAIGADLRNG